MFRIPRVLLVSARSFIAILLLLGSLGVVTPIAAQETDPVQDLAAMALNPNDLDAIGLTGFGINTGRFANAETLATMVTARMGGDPADYATALDSNGFVSAYTVELAKAKVLGDPSQGLIQVVSSSIIEFEDEAGATAAYNAIANIEAIPGAVDLSEQLGGGFSARTSVVPTEGYEPVEGIVSIRQAGTWIGSIVVVPASNVEVANPLIERLMEKVDALTSNAGPDLGRRILRLNGATVESERGYYSIDRSNPLRVLTQNDEEFARFGQRYSGVSNGYQQTQIVSGADGSRLSIRTTVVSFPTDIQATIWTNAALTRQGQLTDPEDIEVDDAFPAIGTQSISLTYSLESGGMVRQGTFRDGRYVAVLDIVNLEDNQLVGRVQLEELSALQADCLANTCDPREPPASVATGIVATPRAEDGGATPDAESSETPIPAETAVASTPEPEPTEVATDTPSPVETPAASTPEPEPTETPTEAPQATETPDAATPTESTASPEVESPVDGIAVDDLYGIQVEFDPEEWQAIGKSVEGTRSSFDLDNGTSTVSFVADTKYSGDPEACLNDALVYLETSLGATDITEILDASGNSTVLITDEAAQGYYSYNDADDELVASFLYCTVVTPGSTTFLAIGIAPADDFTEQLPIIVELVESTEVRR